MAAALCRKWHMVCSCRRPGKGVPHPVRKLVVFFVAAAFAAAMAQPAMAQPPEDTPFTAAATATGLVAQTIATVGDDSFSTMDLSSALASNGSPTQHYGPFPSSSPDSSTCGNDWAQDTFDRDFTVRSNGDGTFSVVEQFKGGSFLTMAGFSPGGCDTDPGGTVRAGVSGSMHGYLVIAVTGAQTSQSASCVPTGPCTTTGFIQSHFTGSAFTIGTFFFHYAAGDQSLAHGEWKNASCDRAGNQGDVASTSPLGLQKSPLCP
jgi:hypothetical protein